MGFNPVPILIDQGDEDQFFTDKQLLPEKFITAVEANPNFTVNYRLQKGYDHSYWFIVHTCFNYL